MFDELAFDDDLLYLEEDLPELWFGAIYQGVDYSWRLEISVDGRLRNTKTLREYSLCCGDGGYLQACVSIHGRKMNIHIHRCVAETLLLNPCGYEIVNHIDGHKNQIRIPLKEQNVIGGRMTKAGFLANLDGMPHCGGTVIRTPYEIGDVIGIKETWAVIDGEYVYRADDEVPAGWHLTSWSPSIHIPYEAIRLFLHVSDIRVEHLNCITNEDIEREGVWLDGTLDPLTAFSQMWADSLSNKMNEKYSWDKDPLVWVVTFCVVDKIEVSHGG